MGVRATEPGVGGASGMHSLPSVVQRRICKELRGSHLPCAERWNLPEEPLFLVVSITTVQQTQSQRRARWDWMCTLPRCPLHCPFLSFTDDTVTSSTSESSALSKKRFTLQGFANLKGQKGKRHPPKIVSRTGPSPWWHVSHPFV